MQTDTERVTLERLAANKRLDAQLLRDFGVENVDVGVRFRYLHPDGTPARSRLRVAMRGADGSVWDSGGEGIAPYWHPRPPYADAAQLIVVEGESDCWTAWGHAFRCLGIPGSDQWSTVRLQHLAGVTQVYLQREDAPMPSRTFPRGIDAYLGDVAAHLRSIGYTGEMLELRMPDGYGDLGDLYVADPGRFSSRLSQAMRDATPWTASAP